MSKSNKTVPYAASPEPEETKMPAGHMSEGSGMNGGNGLTASEMPSGQMFAPGASPGSIAISGFSGSIAGNAGLAESEMPGGLMSSAQLGSDDGLTVTDMPTGQIQSSGNAEEPGTDVLPVLEITGEWLLTLSPTSLKKSRGN